MKRMFRLHHCILFYGIFLVGYRRYHIMADLHSIRELLKVSENRLRFDWEQIGNSFAIEKKKIRFGEQKQL